MGFTAISNVKELDLFDCHITAIGDEYAFENLSKLQLLNLVRNLLTTLPEGIFAIFSIQTSNETFEQLDKSVIIRLGGNPWHCDCKFEHEKSFLNEFPMINTHVA